MKWLSSCASSSREKCVGKHRETECGCLPAARCGLCLLRCIRVFLLEKARKMAKIPPRGIAKRALPHSVTAHIAGRNVPSFPMKRHVLRGVVGEIVAHSAALRLQVAQCQRVVLAHSFWPYLLSFPFFSAKTPATGGFVSR